MKTIFFFLPAILFWFGYFQLETGKIEGVVSDSQSKTAIQNANVYAYQNGILVANTLTDVNGKYSFKVPIGITVIKVTHSSFDMKEVPNVLVEKDKIKQCNIKTWREFQ